MTDEILIKTNVITVKAQMINLIFYLNDLDFQTSH